MEALEWEGTEMKLMSHTVALAVGALFMLVVTAAPAVAHCDTLDGPVVKAAREALGARDVRLVLGWVAAKDEAEIRAAFDQALKVRALGSEARDLADRYFFETVVRVHRASEGEPYTGLKPAGQDPGPGIQAAEEALEKGSVEPLARTLAHEVENATRARYTAVVAHKGTRPDDVEGTRARVRAYVEYIHFVERIHDAAAHEDTHSH